MFGEGHEASTPADLIDLAEHHAKGAHNAFIGMTVQMKEFLQETREASEEMIRSGASTEEVNKFLDRVHIDSDGIRDTADALASIQIGLSDAFANLAKVKLLASIEAREAV